MPELARPVGLGLASRGSVSDMVEWADNARRKGLHSFWLHDSLYERDAVTYASAIASRVPDIRVALGALSSYTRHPVLTAMTISALDDMAPGRIVLGMGTALPLRLAQMGIPYTPDQGVASVSKAIDTIRAMWAGDLWRVGSRIDRVTAHQGGDPVCEERVATPSHDPPPRHERREPHAHDPRCPELAGPGPLRLRPRQDRRDRRHLPRPPVG